MKILHIDSDDLKNPIGGGQAIRTFEINRRLAKRHQVTVVTVNYPTAKNETIENIKYVRVGQKKFPWSFFGFVAKIPKIARTFDFDLLVENFTPPFGPSMTPLFTKKPVIGMVDWAFAGEMSRKYKLPLFLWQGFGLKFYRNFIFPTDAFRKETIGDRHHNLNILTLNNQPLSEFPRSSEFEKTKNYALYIGRIDIHQKGIDLMLEAYSKISDFSRIPLYIAGDGRDKKKMEKNIGKLKLTGNIKMLGRIGGKEKLRYLKEARIVIFPSRYESSCIVALECLVLKKAMVTFDIPVIKESTQNQAVFAKHFDTDDLALKIVYAWDNSDKISKNIKFETLPSWDEAAKIQENFYLKVLREHEKNKQTQKEK